MPRGGKRVGAGRPPDPSSLAEAIRIESGAIRTLPKQRQGRAPAWPLTSRASAAERSVWADLWKLPQAIVWEEQHSARQVAMYVRTSVEAEENGATPTLRSLLLRQETALLLTNASLLSAGFRISTQPTPVPVVQSSSAQQSARRAVPSSRGRLRAVEDVGPD